MTEYELSDLILTNTDLMYTDGAVFMTLLSAYIVIVHLVGCTLTRFQYAFINVTFIGLALSSALGWLSVMRRTMRLMEELASIDPESVVAVGGGLEGAMIYFVFRSFVIVGALIYAWQIRRGNTVISGR